MLTLGIHDGHSSTACLMEDGEVIACISEERINREKEWMGFPAQSIKKCLEMTAKTVDQIEAVGFCSLMPQIGHSGYFNPPWHKKLFGIAAKFVPASILQSAKNAQRIKNMAPKLFGSRQEGLLVQLEKVGIPRSKAKFYEHHELHAATAYYTSWYKDRKSLVITLDGSGDAVCATINIGENGKLERLAEVFNYNSICELYTRMTQFLGMKPMSHEYKVMGMSPYASEYGRQEVVDRLSSYFHVPEDETMQIYNTSGVWKWQFEKKLAKDLHGVRFDIVCGVAQIIFEDVVMKWIRNAIKQTGVTDVVLSGGGFMNVKLNYLITELPEVTSTFIFPGCGDESNPVGAAALAAIDNGYDWKDIKPLHMTYWGPEYSNDDCKKAIDNTPEFTGMKISYQDDVNQYIAEKVAEENVVGRMVGKMEWGARSLGNRSIVADPRKQQIIHKINKAIKMRDFWMPFAPAVLDSYRDKYLKIREDFPCPYMTIAPESKPAAWDAITAGLHPFDKTARSQILDADHHPSFHDLVNKFEQITGVGGVLNTSFNLHGDPVVMTPEDAIYTFLNSGLDVLQLENWVVEKVNA
ncbi:MAG: carbamoyltransferase C-terminal domain-containing protein [Rubripirellula sp.]